MNTVFDLKPIRHGPATGNEKVHEFFEREGRPEAAPIRDWIEHWYGQLPPAKQPDMRGRLRSDDIHQFTSAYFELQMFAMLRTMEYEVTVEPTLAAGRYNPDFLARREDETFYLEATVCGQDAGDLRATRNDEDAVEKIRAAFEYEKVNIHSHLWLQAEGALSDTISANKITRAFADLMRRTTAAEVHRSHESDPHHHQHRTQYREQFEYGDWRLEGFLEPKLHKDAAGHVWGPARSAVGDATESIRTSLADKARPWRKMGPPDGIFVVAMSICHGQYFWNDGGRNARDRGRLDERQSDGALATRTHGHQRHSVRRQRLTGQRTSDESKAGPQPGARPARVSRTADEGGQTGKSHRIPTTPA